MASRGLLAEVTVRPKVYFVTGRLMQGTESQYHTLDGGVVRRLRTAASQRVNGHHDHPCTLYRVAPGRSFDCSDFKTSNVLCNSNGIKWLV